MNIFSETRENYFEEYGYFFFPHMNNFSSIINNYFKIYDYFSPMNIFFFQEKYPYDFFLFFRTKRKKYHFMPKKFMNNCFKTYEHFFLSQEQYLYEHFFRTEHEKYHFMPKI